MWYDDLCIVLGNQLQATLLVIFGKLKTCLRPSHRSGLWNESSQDGNLIFILKYNINQE